MLARCPVAITGLAKFEGQLRVCWQRRWAALDAVEPRPGGVLAWPIPAQATAKVQPGPAFNAILGHVTEVRVGFSRYRGPIGMRDGTVGKWAVLVCPGMPTSIVTLRCY